MGRLRPLKAPLPRTPHLPCLGCTADGGGLGGPWDAVSGRAHLPGAGITTWLGGGGRRPLKETAVRGGSNDPSLGRAPGCISGSFWIPEEMAGTRAKRCYAMRRLSGQPFYNSPLGAGWGRGGRLRQVGASVLVCPYGLSWSWRAPRESPGGHGPGPGTAVGSALSGTWVVLEEISSLLGLRVGTRWRGDRALRPVGVRETRGVRSEASLRCGFDR